MDVTQTLMNEHQLILKYIDLIQLLTHLEDKQRRDAFIGEHGEKLIDFIQNYADRYHHAKEENILFKKMEEPGVLTHCNPLPQMLHEHQQGRECVAAMIASLSDKDVGLFCENASAYGILLFQHIYKEDNVLYPMAEQGLDDTAKQSILHEYLQTEQRMNADTNLTKFYEQKLIELKNQLI